MSGSIRKPLKILLALILVVGVMIIAGTRLYKSDALSRKKTNDNIQESKAIFSVRKFMGKKIKLKVTGKLKVPIGILYELHTNDGKLYFQVEKKSGKVIYASIGDIKFRETSAAVINSAAARKIAGKFARLHQEDFKGFGLDANQADYFWPKPTYWTFIWHHQSSSNQSDKFAKVTVDAIAGKVVSFGIGEKDWSSFCLPDKKQAPWRTKQT